MGPQSTLFFVLLLAAFCALLWWMTRTKRLAVKILAGVLAFAPAMMFGVAAVNKYYDYYETWGSAYDDLTNQTLTAPALPYFARAEESKAAQFVTSAGNKSGAARDGLIVRLIVTGPISRITRNVYVYLPPQYFQPAYQRYTFPVIELLHGYPGVPQDWITVLNVNTVFKQLLAEGQARPAVLVMPDANGGTGVSLQCLNQFHGPQDATYLAVDLPRYIARTLRVAAPGKRWGIAGLSEGGFCAANLGLRYRADFGFAAAMSGYFRPLDNQLHYKRVSPFGRHLAQKLANTPDYEIAALPPHAAIPMFWLGVGTSDSQGISAAGGFYELVRLIQPSAQLRFVPGGHTAQAWRALLPLMLEWMTRRLAAEPATGFHSSPGVISS
jgi:enterochelin esterase-like enzyme